MITVTNLSLSFNGQKLFSGADLKFLPGNCYGIIGANGAGKSTFLRILSGDLEPTGGQVVIPPGQRLSTLKQNQFAYDAFPVLDTVIMGNRRLYDIMKEKEALYEKPDFTDADGEKAAELEGEFAEMDGWNAESDAAALLTGLGIPTSQHTGLMSALDGGDRIKVLLAQALFGNPDILLLDEPTNNLDNRSVAWLESFLMSFPGTLIVVSHDRWFLNNVCTHIVDIDYNQVRMYVGNYDFWYESSRLMQRLMSDQKKRRDEKILELKTFIQRFSSNKSKAKQATSRRRLLDQLTVEEMPASSRRYPYVAFTPDREAGKDILTVDKVGGRRSRWWGTSSRPPPCSASSPGRSGPTAARSNGASPSPPPIFPTTIPPISRERTKPCWNGSPSTPPSSWRPICASSSGACCFPATTFTSRSRSSRAAKRCA